MNKHTAVIINRVLLGLVFLIAGILKIIRELDSGGVTGMMAGFGLPAATLLAWILILVEVLSGAAIIFGYKLKYATIGPIVIMIIATFTVYLANYQQMAIHLALASNLLLMWAWTKK